MQEVTKRTERERLIDASIVTLIKETFFELKKGNLELSDENILQNWETAGRWEAIDKIIKQAPASLLGACAEWNRDCWKGFITASVRAMSTWHTLISLPS